MRICVPEIVQAVSSIIVRSTNKSFKEKAFEYLGLSEDCQSNNNAQNPELQLIQERLNALMLDSIANHSEMKTGKRKEAPDAEMSQAPSMQEEMENYNITDLDVSSTAEVLKDISSILDVSFA